MKDAAARLVFSGGSELHGVDAVSEKGTLRFPPLPLGRTTRNAHIEVRAKGWFLALVVGADGFAPRTVHSPWPATNSATSPFRRGSC